MKKEFYFSWVSFSSAPCKTKTMAVFAWQIYHIYHLIFCARATLWELVQSLENWETPLLNLMLSICLGSATPSIPSYHAKNLKDLKISDLHPVGESCLGAGVRLLKPFFVAPSVYPSLIIISENCWHSFLLFWGGEELEGVVQTLNWV